MSVFTFSTRSSAQGGKDDGTATALWSDVDESLLPSPPAGARLIVPERYRTLALNPVVLRTLLGKAPMEFTGGARVEINLPLPDGGFGRFSVEESPIMEPSLAARHPEIKTYRGQGLDDPTATARFGYTPAGFHAIVLSAGDTFYIDPYAKNDAVNHISYYKRDLRGDKRFECHFGDFDSSRPTGTNAAGNSVTPNVASAGTLRTYRLALAATGEYTMFFSELLDSDEVKKDKAFAAMTATMNRVNGVYEREVSVRMIFIAQQRNIIYTNAATDPYPNDPVGITLLSVNQANLDAPPPAGPVGEGNYDIGHLVNTGSGGVAYLGSVCDRGDPNTPGDGFNAGGYTGLNNPTGDGFDIDFVAHEMGHQFGGNHTFNGQTGSCSGGNRSPGAAYEPGSGTTIQAYAGICGAQNLQLNSNDYFHIKSLEEIVAFIRGDGNACATQVTVNNAAPAISAGADYTIPKNTPFILTATGSDPNGDALTYGWEEYDLGPAATAGNDRDSDGMARPIFRSYLPTTNPARTFPSLQYILNNANTPPTTYSCGTRTCLTGEVLPQITRTMQFQVTARDNRAAGGGINSDLMLVNVRAESGPFLVTQPNTAVTYTGNSTQTVTWDVANTTAAPVSAANVRISLSTDGGQTFPTVLSASTANDGSETITVPNVSTSTARIKVEAVGNIFFDISNANFIIEPQPNLPPQAANDSATTNGGSPVTINVLANDSDPDGNTLTVTAVSDPPNGTAVNNNNGTVTYTPDANFTGLDSFSYTISDGNGGTANANVAVTVVAAAAGLQYYPLPRPLRLLDTRAGQSACDAPGAPLAGGTTRTQSARITCEGLTIPATAQVIVGNATVVNTTADSDGGFITLYPGGAARPTASNLNYVSGQIVPNAFVVGLGTDGTFNIYTSDTTNFIVDVTGYYAPPTPAGLYYHALPRPLRLLDTRAGQPACDAPGQTLTAGQARAEQARVTCDGLTIPASAQAIVGNATVVNDTGGQTPGNVGFVTLYPTGVARPNASNLNYTPGQIVPNAFTVGLGGDGGFNIYATEAINFIVDVTGYYSTEATDINGLGLSYFSIAAPIRLLDTRAGQPGCDTPGAPLTGGATRTQPARVTCSGVTIPANALAIVGNATVVNNTGGGSGFVTLYPSGVTRPTASNLNYVSGQIVPNMFVVGLGGDGAFNIYVTSGINFIVDIAGFFAP